MIRLHSIFLSQPCNYHVCHIWSFVPFTCALQHENNNVTFAEGKDDGKYFTRRTQTCVTKVHYFFLNAIFFTIWKREIFNDSCFKCLQLYRIQKRSPLLVSIQMNGKRMCKLPPAVRASGQCTQLSRQPCNYARILPLLYN